MMKIFSFKNSNEVIRKFILFIIRIFIAAVFIFSGVAKLLEIQGFIQIVHKFQIVPELVLPYFAAVLPAIELFLGLCLMFNLYVRLSIISLTVLLTIFIIAITITMVRGISVNCGCFGGFFKDVVGLHALAKDFFLLGFLIFFIRFHKKYFVTP